MNWVCAKCGLDGSYHNDRGQCLTLGEPDQLKSDVPRFLWFLLTGLVVSALTLTIALVLSGCAASTRNYDPNDEASWQAELAQRRADYHEQNRQQVLGRSRYKVRPLTEGEITAHLKIRPPIAEGESYTAFEQECLLRGIVPVVKSPTATLFRMTDPLIADRYFTVLRDGDRIVSWQTHF